MSDVEGDDAPAAAVAAPVVASSGPMGIDAAIQVIINIHILNRKQPSCEIKRKIVFQDIPLSSVLVVTFPACSW
jgi:hypothetical protein